MFFIPYQQKMSNRGYNETLMVPSNYKDGNSVSLKAFDSHFRTLNNGLLSVAQNLSGMHTKVTNLESVNKAEHEVLLHRVEQLESRLAELSAKLEALSEEKKPPVETPVKVTKKTLKPKDTSKPKDAILLRGTNVVLTGKGTASKTMMAKITNNTRVPSLDTPEIEEPAEQELEPVTLEPVEPVVSEPVEPVVSEPVEPVVSEPVEPVVVSEPVEPVVVSEPVEPLEPVEPVVSEPAVPVISASEPLKLDSDSEELSELEISDSEEEVKPVKKPIVRQPAKKPIVRQPTNQTEETNDLIDTPLEEPKKPITRQPAKKVIKKTAKKSA